MRSESEAEQAMAVDQRHFQAWVWGAQSERGCERSVTTSFL